MQDFHPKTFKTDPGYVFGGNPGLLLDSSRYLKFWPRGEKMGIRRKGVWPSDTSWWAAAAAQWALTSWTRDLTPHLPPFSPLPLFFYSGKLAPLPLPATPRVRRIEPIRTPECDYEKNEQKTWTGGREAKASWPDHWDNRCKCEWGSKTKKNDDHHHDQPTWSKIPNIQ